MRIRLQSYSGRYWIATLDGTRSMGTGETQALALGDLIFNHPTACGLELEIHDHSHLIADAALAQAAADWSDVGR